ncbi:hypothetical protein MUA27_05575 [Mammaliicoccus sciuri]|uniref:hypothetical protein n=1 Tax=Mammaliicoccus sciuri TaxID=1296 RepID=UPI0021D017CE|nr:hypothetical protein [Mammaliicoccus sciuri]UXU79080.1 hypothetical protein MUA27_05575 [Mammaliicoccus sciuri]
MELKAGGRVHVTRYSGEKVDFYATIVKTSDYLGYFTNCTDEKYINRVVSLPTLEKFGPDELDYYTLSTVDEVLEIVEGKRI